MEPKRITWIVVANGSEARVLASSHRFDAGPFTIREMTHAETRAREQDVITGERGRTSASAVDDRRAAMARRTDHHEREVTAFAHEIGEWLYGAYTDHDFAELVVVAPPQMLGALRDELDGPVAEALRTEVAKDLTSLRDDEVLERIAAEV